MFELTPEGMTQSLYTNGLSGETNGNLDRKIVEIRNDSLMTAVCTSAKSHFQQKSPLLNKGKEKRTTVNRPLYINIKEIGTKKWK